MVPNNSIIESNGTAIGAVKFRNMLKIINKLSELTTSLILLKIYFVLKVSSSFVRHLLFDLEQKYKSPKANTRRDLGRDLYSSSSSPTPFSSSILDFFELPFLPSSKN
jgi:hypothetical protein